MGAMKNYYYDICEALERRTGYDSEIVEAAFFDYLEEQPLPVWPDPRNPGHISALVHRLRPWFARALAALTF